MACICCQTRHICVKDGSAPFSATLYYYLFLSPGVVPYWKSHKGLVVYFFSRLTSSMLLCFFSRNNAIAAETAEEVGDSSRRPLVNGRFAIQLCNCHSKRRADEQGRLFRPNSANQPSPPLHCHLCIHSLSHTSHTALAQLPTIVSLTSMVQFSSPSNGPLVIKVRPSQQNPPLMLWCQEQTQIQIGRCRNGGGGGGAQGKG